MIVTYLTFVLPVHRLDAAGASQENQTLTVWLASFTTSRGTDRGPLMAAATLTSLPVVIFCALVQRRVAFGLTAGAVAASGRPTSG